MPRKSLGRYLQYDREKIPDYVAKIRAGTISIKKAAAESGIPFSTLRDRTSERVEVTAQPGTSTVLTRDEELQLRDYLIKLSELGVGKSKEQVQELAYMIIKRDPTRSHVSEIWIKNTTAGKDWYYGYMKRHQDLSLRKPEKLSKARSRMTNESVLKNFYDVLEPILTNDEGESLDAKFIFNCDETGVPLDFRPSRVVASRKSRSVWSINSGDKTQITVMGCGNAAGTMIPPLVIFKGVRTNSYLVDGAPEGWGIRFTKSGWMNGCVFEDWLEHHFLPYIDKHIRPHNLTQKIILFLDGHLSHETLYSLELASKRHVEIVCLPPQTTHVLQPLDISFFKSLKSRWDKVNQTYCRTHHGKFVKKTNFTKIFQEAWDQCGSNTEMVKNGFTRIGLSPFRRMSLKDILGDKDLSPANALNRPMPQLTQGEDDSSKEPTAEPMESSPCVEATRSTGELAMASRSAASSPLTEGEEELCPSTSAASCTESAADDVTSQCSAPSSSLTEGHGFEFDSSSVASLYSGVESSHDVGLWDVIPGAESTAEQMDFAQDLDDETQILMDKIAAAIASNSDVININNTSSASNDSNENTIAPEDRIILENPVANPDTMNTPDPSLSNILVLPEFDTSSTATTTRRRRNVNPHCRVLTSEKIIEEKRQKLASEKEKANAQKSRSTRKKTPTGKTNQKKNTTTSRKLSAHKRSAKKKD